MGQFFRQASLLVAAACAAAGAFAQTAKVWSGPEWGDFATGANWGGTAPTSNTTTNYASFTSTSATGNFVAVNASRSIAGLDFSTNANGGGISYSAGTPVLTLGAYGIKNSAAAQVSIDVGLALGAASTFTNNADLWITSALALGANTLTLNGTSTYFARLAGIISGTGGITINHTGSGGGWVFGSNNTYSGTTTLTAGNIIAGTGGFGTGTLTFNGGTLQAQSAATYANAISVANTANIATSSSADLTFSGATTMTASRTFNVSGDGRVIFSGAVGQSAAGYALTKAGAGTMVLNAASTYTGTTTITGGSLALGSAGTISNANLVLNGGTLATKGTWSRTLGTGVGQFQFGTGGGGFAAYGGALTVSVAGGASDWYTFFNGQYAYFGSSVSDNVVTFTNNLELFTGTDFFLSVADNTASTADKTVFSGILSGGGNLNKLGAGQLNLTAASTRTGTTYITGGTLRAENAGALGSGAVVLQFSTLQLAADTATTFGNNVSTNSGTVTITSDRLTAGTGMTHRLGTLSLSSTLNLTKGTNATSGTAGIAFGAASGAGTFNLGSGVKLELASFAGSGPVTFTGAGDAEILGALNNSGTNTVTKSGAGRLILGGASTRTGATTLGGGTLTLGHGSALGTGTLTMAGGTILEVAADSAQSVTPQINVSSSSQIVSNRATAGAGLTHSLGTVQLAASSSAALTKGANVTSGAAGFALNAINLAGANATLSVGSGVAASLGAVTGTNTSFNLSLDGDLTITGALATGTGSLMKNGAGTLTLNAASTRTGGNSFVFGTLALGHDEALGSGALNFSYDSAVVRSAGGARTIANGLLFFSGIHFGGSDNLTFTGSATNYADNTLYTTNTGGTTLSGALALSNSATNRTLTLDTTGALVLSGVISNGSTSTAGALIKNGTGLLTLSGTNTYAGNTTINAGTLNLTGSIANSAMTTIANGATLTGAGSLGDLTLNGTYAPGNSPALVALGDFTLGTTGLLQMEIGGLVRGTGYDALDINGLFTTGGTLDVSFINGFTPSASATFNLFDFTSATGTFGTINLPTLASGYSWDLSALYSAGELKLIAAAVPEPSTYALMVGFGALAMTVWRRRQSPSGRQS